MVWVGIVGFLVLWWLLGFWWALGITILAALFVSDEKIATYVTVIGVVGGLAYVLIRGGWNLFVDFISIFL